VRWSFVAMLAGEIVMWHYQRSNLFFLSLVTEIHHLVYEQDGAAVSRATSKPSTIDGLRQTRSTSKHKQRNHEATPQGTE
jgi:hypothetical protein